MQIIPILALLVVGCLTSSETTTATESTTTTESANSTTSSGETNSSTETNHTTSSSSSSSTHTTEPIDVNTLPCKSAEFAEETKESVMDGKCIRSYYRVDQFSSIEVGEQFAYLLENYCANLQTQPMTCEQYINRKKYDEQALEMYKELYRKYKTGSATAPSVDCLGIARTVFCAYQFNYCDPHTGKALDHVVCSFLCTTWDDRCPAETEFKELVCKNQGDGQCARARRNWLLFLAFLLVILFL